MQVKDLIYAGFRIAGVLANAGRNFLESGSHYQDAFAILNAMLDSWNTERLTVFSIKQHDQNLVPLQQTYTIGPGGDWNAPRPSRIERAQPRRPSGRAWLACPWNRIRRARRCSPTEAIR